MLFRYLVESVISYGVELQGWGERKELEKIMQDYIKWMFRLDLCTGFCTKHLITKELGMDKLKIGQGIRVRKYEKKIETIGNERQIKVCF